MSDLGKKIEAIVHFDFALKINGKDLEAFIGKGNTLVELGKY